MALSGGDAAISFTYSNPGIRFLAPDSLEWAKWRETRGKAGQECKPLGIAIPSDVEQVGAIVRWAKSSGVDITVRSGGNDFYGRNVVDGGVIIDMREIKNVNISPKRHTVTIGGGVITKDLVLELEKENLCVPVGNNWIVGYVGWVTYGGYGPLEGAFGMGFEGILAAEVVNADGDIVEADEDMLEGIRGLGGNMGIITSLTIKTYPNREIYSGLVMMDATPENLKAVISLDAKLNIPMPATLHYFVITRMKKSMLAVMVTWATPDHDKGKQFVDGFISQLPPLIMSMMSSKTLKAHYESLPTDPLPWGSQRCLYVEEMSPTVVDIMIEALESMPENSSMSWSMTTHAAYSITPPNFFCDRRHRLLCFSDMVPEETLLPAAMAWNNDIYAKIRASGDSSLLDESYPPLTRPGDRTTEQLLGEKFANAKELKDRFDPERVFKHALPTL